MRIFAWCVSVCLCVCYRGYAHDAEESMKSCQVLLQENNVDSAVRIGDIYGMMVEHFAGKQKWKAVRTPTQTCTRSHTYILPAHTVG